MTATPTLVRYTGSNTDVPNRLYTARPCSCDNLACRAGRSGRLVLAAPNTDRVEVWHVRATSVTPVPRTEA